MRTLLVASFLCGVLVVAPSEAQGTLALPVNDVSVFSLLSTMFGEQVQKYVSVIPAVKSLVTLASQFTNPDLRPLNGTTINKLAIVEGTVALATALCNIPGAEATVYVGSICSGLRMFSIPIVTGLTSYFRSDDAGGKCVKDRQLLDTLTGDEESAVETILEDISCALFLSKEDIETNDTAKIIFIGSIVSQYGKLLQDIDLIVDQCITDYYAENYEEACQFVQNNRREFRSAYMIYMEEVAKLMEMFNALSSLLIDTQ